jgi:1-acyl-sn-glycerol-3-phosphate acyltransferase
VFYRFVRATIRFALGLFYRLQVVFRGQDLDGPVMFVGNHNNSLIDPALVFVITARQVTFLAREPLFRAPLFGWVLRGLGALPVYRKQDHPGLMEKNEGTLEAAAGALRDGKAIVIFPEGKSHSDPQMAEIKTGCARIALRVVKGGKPLRIVPVGLTYAQKHRFHSRVQVEVGEPLVVPPAPASPTPEDETEWVRALTDQVAEKLRAVTLNLEEWADLKLIETAENLYSLKIGEKTKDPERMRRFAQGVKLLRAEQPERFERIREDVMSFRMRLEMVNADPSTLKLQYRRSEVARFIGRNLLAMVVGFPLFFLGMLLFFIPFWAVRLSARVLPLSKDRVGTYKFVASLLLTPVWQSLLCWLAYRGWGAVGAVLALALAMPLALYTRYFVERRRSAFGDVLTFFTIGSRSRLKDRLIYEGEALAAQIEKVAVELRPRVVPENAA